MYTLTTVATENLVASYSSPVDTCVPTRPPAVPQTHC